MARTGVCPICGTYGLLTRHHVLKWKVFHNDKEDNIIYLCPSCHNEGKDCLEELVRERENELLRNYPEIYKKALEDYIKGARPKGGNYEKKKRRQTNNLSKVGQKTIIV